MKTGDIFPGDGSETDQEKIQQHPRHPVFPPAPPVADVVAQGIEVGDARPAQGRFDHRADRAGGDARPEGLQWRGDKGRHHAERMAAGHDGAGRGQAAGQQNPLL